MQFNDYIQVAGVRDRAEAEMLVRCGVRYLGFPLRLPVHHEDLSEEAASRIIKRLETVLRGVLITYLDRASSIIEFCNSLGVSIVQLHGDIEPAELRTIKERQPSLTIIKSLVIGRHPIQELTELADRTAAY